MKKVLLFFLCIFSITLSAQIVDPVKWNIELENNSKIILKAKIEEGWHLYDTNLPQNGPISTSFHIDSISGAELNGDLKSLMNPTKEYDNSFDMELRWFSNVALFSQDIDILDSLDYYISGYVDFMACKDGSCTKPPIVNFLFSSDSTLKSPQKSISKKIFISPTLGKKDENKSEVDFWEPIIDKIPKKDGSTSNEDGSFLIIFLTGLLGGFIALLTPCVWPIIPMTVSFFIKRSKTKIKAIKEAIIYGFSIIIIFLTLGLSVTLIFGAGALNQVSTSAFFNILFFLLLVVFALSFFGLFEMTLPSSWVNNMDQKVDSKTGIVSIFFMALTLVLVSFSCTGPIIGTLLVQTAALNSLLAPALGMFGFSLGLALPFTFFALFPNLLQKAPRSGSWLNSIKVILGFIELAFALKFLSVADLAYGWGILSRTTFIIIWIVLFVFLGLYLFGVYNFPSDGKRSKPGVISISIGTISTLFSLWLISGFFGNPLTEISAFTPPLESKVNYIKDFDLGMKSALEKGKPVFIDFSGYGCVNCRKMEESVLNKESIKNLLNNNFVSINLVVDDRTKLDSAYLVNEFGRQIAIKSIGDKNSYLQRFKFGANAQPYYIILDNKGLPISWVKYYDEDVLEFEKFLKEGLKNYKKIPR